MEGIKSLREKFPQYEDLSDGQLAFGVYNKFYSDMPIVGFAKQIGLDKAQSLEMLKSANSVGKGLKFEQPEPSVGGGAMGALRSGFQGLTLGGGDEIVAGGVSALKKLTGDERSMGDIYSQELELERSRLGQFEEQAPKTALASEVVSSMALPIGPVKTMGQAALTGLGYGAASGFLSGEGSAADRAKSLALNAALGGMFGAGFKKASDMVGSGFERYLSDKAAKAIARGGQSVDELKASANALYEEARASGATISKDAFENFVSQTIAKVSGGVDEDIAAKLTPSSAAVLEAMKRKVGQSVGVDDLDAFRKLAQTPAGKVTDKGEQRAASMIIEGIDDFVDSINPEQLTSGTIDGVSETFKAARDMWARMRRTEKLQNIIETAKEGGYAGGFESGLKTQIGTILRNPKQRRGFSEGELRLLSEIQTGTPLGRALAGISYLGFSPSGGRTVPTGGLVTGGLVGGFTGGPLGALVGAGVEAAATTGLRAVREMSMEKRARLLQEIISTGMADQVAQKAPEAFKLLQEAAVGGLTRGATQATAGQ
jgi:hypothetical protein